MSGTTRPKTSPLRATVPLSCFTKQSSGLRSPGAPFTVLGEPDKQPIGPIIRRTASLDTIYLKGMFPKESFFWSRDKATQTERANSLDSIQVLGLENKTAKLMIRSRRRSCSRDDKDANLVLRNSSSILRTASTNAPPKSSRNSEEGLNQELELYAPVEPLRTGRLQEPIEGRKAPVAELIREKTFSEALLRSSNQTSSGDSQDSSPDQDRMFSGSSPHINRFLSRAPPDGCERILSKSVPILRPIPREVVSSHPNTLFTLKPSYHSAFETLQRNPNMIQQDRDGEKHDRHSPKVPD